MASTTTVKASILQLSNALRGIGGPGSTQIAEALESLQSTINVIATNLPAGYTGTIATAKLTGGGANGSMTFASGVLTTSTPAT